MHRRHPDQPTLITDAPASPDDEYDRRRKKYAALMAARTAAVVAAALVYRISIWLAVAFIVGGVVLPWCAVIIANDRGPVRKRRRGSRFVSPPSERALPAPHDDDRTIEG